MASSSCSESSRELRSRKARNTAVVIDDEQKMIIIRRIAVRRVAPGRRTSANATAIAMTIAMTMTTPIDSPPPLSTMTPTTRHSYAASVCFDGLTMVTKCQIPKRSNCVLVRSLTQQRDIICRTNKKGDRKKFRTNIEQRRHRFAKQHKAQLVDTLPATKPNQQSNGRETQTRPRH